MALTLTPQIIRPLAFAAAAAVAAFESAHATDDGVWLSVGPISQRSSHSTIYDAAHDRLVVFGGSSALGNDVWTLALAGTIGWRQEFVVGSPPAARRRASAICDEQRQRMIVFGGSNGPDTYFNDVWQLTLDGTPAWTQVFPSGTPPTPRTGGAAVYDPIRQRMIMFGGGTNSTYTNETWALSLEGGPEWTLLSPLGTPPSLRFGHTAVYDDAGDRLIVFGGVGAAFSDTVWQLALSGTPEWSVLDATGTPPSPRWFHASAYDPSGRMLVFAGYDGVNPLTDLWELTLDGAPAWHELAPAGSAYPPRMLHSLTYDPVRARMLSFGGSIQCDLCTTTNEILSLSLTGTLEWTRPFAEDQTPQPRSQHSAVLDSRRDRMLIFGGSSFGTLNDTWAQDLNTGRWTDLATSGSAPEPRIEHAAIYDEARDRTIVYGCQNGGNLYAGVWALSLSGSPTWTPLATAGAEPPARWGHTAVYDPVRDRMLVFGGFHGSYALNDVWALSLDGTPTWTQITPPVPLPGPRYWHTAIYDAGRDRMIVFRGAGVGGFTYDDLWELRLADPPTWTQISASGTAPLARQQHSAIYDARRERMVVFGGYYFDGNHHRVNTSWALDLAGTPVWTQLTPAGGLPVARDSHTALYDDVHDRMVVFGGYGAGPLGDTNALTWSSSVGVRPSLDPARAITLRAYPVPWREGVNLELRLPRATESRVAFHDLAGRMVRELVSVPRGDGVQVLHWDGRDASGSIVPPGVYFYRVRAGGTVAAGRVVKIG